MMDFHSTTIRQVEEFFMDNNQSPFNTLTNQLNGIWDGYFYEDTLEMAKQMGLPTHLTNRIEFTEKYIKL
jgi:hypothetical protein